MARKHFPNLTVLARARNRHHAHLLREQGVKVIVRETYYSSLWLAEELLEKLGMERPAVNHLVDIFKEHDKALLDRQYAVFRDDEKLVQTSKEAAEELQLLLEEDRQQAGS
jgi:voltage-gated potassium channel Kch